MTSKTAKYACVFTDCNRVFDRYSRLEAHFRAHINNNVIHRAQSQYHHPISNQPRRRGKSLGPQKRRGQNKKHRSSNLRSHQPIYRNNVPTLIDLRTPSLSPDTPSEMDMETEVEIEDVQTPELPTPTSSGRKGPTWAVAPRSPSISPSPTHLSSRGHQTHEDVSPSTVWQCPGNLTQKTTEVNDGDTTVKVNTDKNGIFDEDVSSNGFKKNNRDSSTFDFDTEESENGDMDQAENAIIHQNNMDQPLSTPNKPIQNTSTIISPFGKLSSGMPQPDEFYISPTSIDKNGNIQQRTRFTQTPSPHPDDESMCTPNSLDRFIQDAMASIGKGRERSETPCPPPRGSSMITTHKKSSDSDEDIELPPIAQAKTVPAHTMSEVLIQAVTPQSPVTADKIPDGTRSGSTPPSASSVGAEDVNPLLIIADPAVTRQPHEASKSDTLKISRIAESEDSSSKTSSPGQAPVLDMSLTVRKLLQLLEDLKEDEEIKRRKLVEMHKLVKVLSEAQSCVLL